jgi:hypothetical protein
MKIVPQHKSIELESKGKSGNAFMSRVASQAKHLIELAAGTDASTVAGTFSKGKVWRRVSFTS